VVRRPNVLRPDELDAFCAVLGFEISDLITPEPEQVSVPRQQAEREHHAVGDTSVQVRRITSKPKSGGRYRTMSSVRGRRCRTCGGPIETATGKHGRRPREHCQACRPSGTARRRAHRDRELETVACQRCGRPIVRAVGAVSKYWRRCESCVLARTAPAEVELDELLAASTSTPTYHSVLSRAAELAEVAAWPPKAIGAVLAALNCLLDERQGGQHHPAKCGSSRAAAVTRYNLARVGLAQYDLLDDDTESSIVAWVERKTVELPDGFRDEVQAWLVELHAGNACAKPRSSSTLYACFGRVRPHLIVWSSLYGTLREVTKKGVSDVLDSLRGHDRQGAFTSLRSLFGFA
jgi:hypothetical protein